jgi:hypothetical protein
MSKILGPDVGYVDILNCETADAMILEAEESDKYYPLRPSSSGKCTRELAYQLNEYLGRAKYVKKPRTPESHRLLALGNPIEYHLVKMLEKYLPMFKIRYKQQVLEFYRLTSDIDPSLNVLVEGSLDLVLWSDQYKCVVDVKSKKDKFSQSFKTDWDATSAKLGAMASVQKISEEAFYVDDLPAFLNELNDPWFAANFLQLNGYACTQFLKDRGIDHAAIIQYCKNDSRVREVRFKPHQGLFDEVRQKFQTVLDAVAEKAPEKAPKDYVLGSQVCAFCPFAQECWGGKDTLKEYFKTWPKKAWPADIPTELEPVAQAYEAALAAGDTAQKHETILKKYMLDNEIKKIRIGGKTVYEIFERKSPYPHFTLKKGKL